MIELKGKYNRAIVYTDNVESEAISQITTLCNQDVFKDSKIRIMPDCHAGKGCTIGTTMTVGDTIVPNLVGVDIGCGVASVELPHDMDLEVLDTIIREQIPSGSSVHKEGKSKILKEIFKIDIGSLKCPINKGRVDASLGTLGGGNHFIEVCKDTKGNEHLIVHTGSRGLGKTVAEYYQKKAEEHVNIIIKELEYERDETIKLLKDSGSESDISNYLDKYRELVNSRKVPKGLEYIEGSLMEDYLHDMVIVQEYAKANRLMIIATILSNFYCKTYDKPNIVGVLSYIEGKVVECTHNYIDIESNILRKGAISSKEGEIVLIPINMKEGVLLCKGKGNTDWNCSAPHGAGRVLSRSKAKAMLEIDDFISDMEGVYTTCVGETTLDEAPRAYKPIDEILSNIGDTVDVIDTLRPIYNFKAN